MVVWAPGRGDNPRQLLLINGFIRPALGTTSLAQLCKQGPCPFEQLYAELRACRRRCHGRTFVEHRTPRPHNCDERCAEHVCKPLAVSAVRQCHAVLSGRAERGQALGWITLNPLDAAQRPRIPAPQPDPPSAGEAAKIANAAWEQDADWGTFVWLTFVTGARRGELVALAWEHIDLVSGLLTIRRNPLRGYQLSRVMCQFTRGRVWPGLQSLYERGERGAGTARAQRSHVIDGGTSK